MGVNKRYYWLKLKEDFFGQKEIKKLRKIAGGDTYTIIYLKMLLRSLANNGILYFDGVEDSFVSELALDINEDEENVAITVQYLITQNILVVLSEEEFLLSTCEEMVGSETASTIRSRKSRNNKKLLHCNTMATIGNTEIERDREKEKYIEKEVRQSAGQMSGQNSPEIEREIERDREIKTGTDKSHVPVNYQLIADMYNDTCVSFPRLKTLSDSRKRAIKARLKTYTVEDFDTLFKKAEASSFLKGANERNWSANFDWLIKDNNMAKVLEGNYDDKPKQGAKRTEPVPSWMTKEKQSYDFDSLEAGLLANNPALEQRVEDLKKRIKEG